jgi:hypothetical protein
MNIDESVPDRIALQPTRAGDDDVLDAVHAVAAAVDDVVAWYTLDVAEYPALDETRAFSGGRGEKVLVVDVGAS